MQLFMCAVLFVTQVTSTYHGHNQVLQHSGKCNAAVKIECPNNGFMSGISYLATAKVDAIEFICASTNGNITFGPYGGGSKRNFSSLICPKQHYISSFYGSYTTTLNRLGIRCRHQDDVSTEGTVIGEFGLKNGTQFDDLTHSLGAWPLLVIIRTTESTICDVFQVAYSNNSASYISKECGNQVRHGTFPSGHKSDNVKCFDDGAIVAFDYTYSIHEEGQRLHSIKFTCSSSAGNTYHGPYGTTGEHSGRAECPNNHHLSYLRGTAGEFVNTIEAVCVRSGEDLFNKKEEERADVDVKNDDQSVLKVVEERELKKTSRRIDVEEFDDSCYGNKGRPVTIRVSSKTYVNGLYILFGKIPVAQDCKITKIELIGDTTPQIIGYEILGTAVGSSCSNLTQQLCLTAQMTTMKYTMKSHANVNKGLFDLQKGFGATLGGWLGSGGEAAYTLTVEWQTNDETQYSTKSSEQTGEQRAQKTTINYQGPGAAVLAGFRSIYEFKKKEVDVLFRYKCRGGSTPPVDGKLDVPDQIYGNVYFEDFHFPFGNRECTTELRLCISRIKLKVFVFRPRSLKEALETEVERCLKQN